MTGPGQERLSLDAALPRRGAVGRGVVTCRYDADAKRAPLTTAPAQRVHDRLTRGPALSARRSQHEHYGHDRHSHIQHGPASAHHAARRSRGLRIEGELDRSTLPALTGVLTSMAGRGSFCVDLGGLPFCDVGGLRSLVTATADMRGGHVLTLRSPSPQVRRLLILTGWHKAAGLRLQARSHALPDHGGPRRSSSAE
ncbi:STAS domain-containing protein [Nonomuraea sp. NPDC049784]|uniref:STAS domain-containing protein n=1 Tax=Nonomuraea sp. NPDC049784 TaxID=3154361 RepID=UPI0033F175FB